MKIAIESTYAQNPVAGIGKYIRNLLYNLSTLDNDNYYYLMHYTKEWNGENFGKRFIPVSYSFGGLSTSVGLKLNSSLEKVNPDIYHSTCMLFVPRAPRIPVITTVHDIYALLNKVGNSKFREFLLRKQIKWSVEYTTHFIFNSNFTKLEFNLFFELEETKGSSVIYPGSSINLEFRDQKTKYSGPMICVGTIEQRKEQIFLIDAYKESLSRDSTLPNLVFIGKDMGLGSELEDRIIKYNLKDKVMWVRYISDEELKLYFNNASVLLYPSSYEGFGIPLIEAMSCGLPIICSDTSVFREVAREYPIYARLKDIESWVNSILSFFKKKPKVNIKAAERLLEQRNWKNCTEKTIACYQKIYDPKTSRP